MHWRISRGNWMVLCKVYFRVEPLLGIGMNQTPEIPSISWCLYFYRNCSVMYHNVALYCKTWHWLWSLSEERRHIFRESFGYLNSKDLLLCIHICWGVGEMHVAKALVMYKKLICIFPSRFFYIKGFRTVGNRTIYNNMNKL